VTATLGVAEETSIEVCREIGCTYRQLQYWVSKGWIPGMRFHGPGNKPGYNEPGWTRAQVGAARHVKFNLDLARALLADPTTGASEHRRRLGDPKASP
jgi:DNA-binding transcriptional MerR regulator